MDPNTTMQTIDAGAKAFTKLGDVFEKVFGPHFTRKQADADAYADERKLQIIRDNPDMDISYTDGKMNARMHTPEALAYRAERRYIADSIRQEDNIEKVFEIAGNELQSLDTISDDPVDDDWIAKFIGEVKDVSSSEMQLIWGKILAGEIAKPKSFSMRTLSIVRNISPSEAHVFERIMPYVIRYEDLSFVSVEKDLAKKHGLILGDLITLDSCGLIQVIPFTSIDIGIGPHEEFHPYFTNNALLSFHNEGDNEIRFTIQEIYLLSEAGTSLLNLLDPDSKNEYFDDWAQSIIHKTNISELSATLHKREGTDEPKRYSSVPYMHISNT